MTPRVPRLIGLAVVDRDGQSLGQVQDVLVDAESNVAAWLLIGRQRKTLFAFPLGRAQLAGGTVILGAGRADVLRSPALDWRHRHLDDVAERRLVSYWDDRISLAGAPRDRRDG